MAEKKCPDCPKCLPGWLVQFGDLMSLLLCFFILLLSMATMDKKKVEEYFEIMRRSMGFLEGAEDTASAESMKQAAQHAASSENASDSDDGDGNDVENLAQEIQEVTKEFNETNDEENEDLEVTVKGNNEFSLDIPSSLMFDSGEYKISNPKTKQFIAKLARIIRTMPQEMDIEVMGYSSSNPSNEDIPRDSWDVSALRAISVVQELIRNKIEPAQLKVAAYGSYHPKSDSKNENRRVELKFISTQNKDKIINESNFFDRIEE